MSQMLRFGNKVMSSSQHFNHLNLNYGYDLSLMNKSPVYDLTTIGSNVEKKDIFNSDSIEGFARIDWNPNDLRQSLIDCSSDVQSVQWNTSFWNNINNSAQLFTNNDFNYINDYNKMINDLEDKKPYILGANDCELPFVEERDGIQIQTPIGTPFRTPFGTPFGTPKIDSLFTTNDQYIQPRMRRRLPTLMECVFCKNNDEEPEFYKSHILKDPESRIMCPILRAYNCPICHNGGGDWAHTLRYCPLNRAGIHCKQSNNKSEEYQNDSRNHSFNSYKNHFQSKNESKKSRRKRRLK